MRLLKRRATHTEPERTVAPAETMVLSPTAAPRIAWADPSWLAWQTLTYSGSAQIKTAGVKHHEADLRALVAIEPSWTPSTYTQTAPAYCPPSSIRSSAITKSASTRTGRSG